MSAARPLQGIVLLLLAVACFATLDASAKYLSLGISVLTVIWFRYLFQALAMSAVVLPTRGWRSLQTAHPYLHLLRAALLLSTSMLGFFSVKYMPVGEFTAIIMLTPMVTTLLAATFLQEKVSALRWLLVAGGFCGALLVAQPGGASSGWVLLLPLGCTLANSLYQILTSRMARTEHAMTLNFYSGWGGALVLTAALPWIWQTPADGQTWALLCLTGATGTPVIGGPTTWQARQLLFGLAGLNIVGADLVEVSPIYDPSGQITALAGATIAHDELYLLGLARDRRAGISR